MHRFESEFFGPFLHLLLRLTSIFEMVGSSTPIYSTTGSSTPIG
jgi:hypothetical protein